jgi:iron-sulfur cluster assembly protein
LALAGRHSVLLCQPSGPSKIFKYTNLTDHTRRNPMAISISEAAARHVTRYITKRGKGVGVRLGVKTTGCSGLAYKLEYADEIAPEDVVFEDNGVKVLIDPKSLAYIDGTQLDFVREGLNEGFRFNNPNERDRCGCGESFRI